MAIQLTLQFDIQSYWHIGSGEEGGAYADALALKDNQGLPYLPGRSIKGLLREAMTLACHNGWFGDNSESETHPVIKHLFGSEGNDQFTQGKISVGSATFSLEEKQYFANTPTAIKHLYQVQHSTAIDHDSGVAKSTSLRSMEVVIPMTLSVNVMIDGDEMDSKRIIDILPLITHLGAKRHRGLGQVIVTTQKRA